MVTSNWPFHEIAEVGLKFEPFTVRVKFGPPGAADIGLNEESTGMGTAETVNGCPFEVTLPGLITVTVIVPTAATSPAGTVAVSWVELTKVVASSDPPHDTALPEAKFEPFTVSVKVALPGATVDGLNELIAGAVD